MEIKVEQPNTRLDKFVSEETCFSRELAAKMISSENILVNGKKSKMSYHVKENDLIYIDETYTNKTDVLPVKMDLNIVYEDDDLMVINKPSGLVVHPGNGNYDNTLVNGLLYYTKNLSNMDDSVIRPGIVHRLDKDTSGLMLVAKTNKAHAILADDFKNKRVHREYVALLDGVFPSVTAFIDAPIGRDKLSFQKMTVLAGGKEARTNLAVIEKFSHHTLVRLVLETGRTHQIRAHMAYIGYPIHNDPVYNNTKHTEFGQFLHSEYIKFIHPITKKELEFRAPLPSEFEDYLKTLD
ncbi:MAG: RluA family pseudouridine synthase [Bacilli bacterium]